jgi:sulfatase maturation enzyme AslB (radical SAM superfamily)
VTKERIAAARPVQGHAAAGLARVDVVLTTACNLRCGYCYQNQHGHRRMGWQTLRHAIDALLASPRLRVTLGFTGGEALLELTMLRRAVAYVRRHARPGQFVDLTLVTNGLLIDAAVASFLAEHGIETQLSFDGLPAAQKLRRRGSFAHLDALLDALGREHLAFFLARLSVAVVVSAATLPHLAPSVRYFLNKGVREILLYPLITADPGWDASATAELDRQLAEIHDLCLQHLQRTGEVPLRLFRKQQAEARAPDNGAMCRVGGGGITVDVDGEAVGCATFATSYQTLPPLLAEQLGPLRLGQVTDPELPRRLADLPHRARALSLFANKAAKRSSLGSCAECRFVQTCSVCPISIGHIPGNGDPDRVPDHVCAFNLLASTWRERFPIQPHPLDELLGRAPGPPWMRKLAPALGD